MESILRNTREVFEREEDNMPLWAKILFRYGISGAIALGLVWLMGTRILDGISRIEANQQRHDMATAFYLRQICTLNAEAAGHSPALCSMEDKR